MFARPGGLDRQIRMRPGRGADTYDLDGGIFQHLVDASVRLCAGRGFFGKFTGDIEVDVGYGDDCAFFRFGCSFGMKFGDHSSADYPKTDFVLRHVCSCHYYVDFNPVFDYSLVSTFNIVLNYNYFSSSISMITTAKVKTMAQIRPFRGTRYNQESVELDQVVTLPYDKITPQMREQYFDHSPYNFARVILGRETPDCDRYQIAARNLKQWREQGVLIKDDSDSLYVSEQEFSFGGRTYRRRGFVALAKVEDYSSGVVFPHEHTFAHHKEDRLRLLRATRVNTGQIFMLYPDPENEIRSLLDPATGAEPEMELSSEGAIHRMWPVTDPAVISSVVGLMQEKKLFIADGHHRYGTAIVFRDEMRKKYGPGPWDWRMMTLVSMDDEDLVILPTHRALMNLPAYDEKHLLHELEHYFDIEPKSVPNNLGAQLPELIGASVHGKNRLGLMLKGGRFYSLTLKGIDAVPKSVRESVPEIVLNLDVSVLHRLIIEHIIGLTVEQQGSEQYIRYIRDPEEVFGLVESGECTLAFLKNPTKIEEIRDVALSGNVMPQKSTDFYPKLLSGMIVRELE